MKHKFWWVFHFLLWNKPQIEVLTCIAKRIIGKSHMDCRRVLGRLSMLLSIHRGEKVEKIGGPCFNHRKLNDGHLIVNSLMNCECGRDGEKVKNHNFIRGFFIISLLVLDHLGVSQEDVFTTLEFAWPLKQNRFF